jgi:NADPH:quinone reductase-like Zn-dependent oxidoreductase
LTKDKILIQVKAVSLNPLDYKIRDGNMRLLTGSKFPKILGADFSGIIKEIGSDISNFKAGDKVYGSCFIIFGKPGALSELILCSPKQIRHIPERMTMEEAGSLPVASLTALNGLQKYGELKGKKILVNGATGGVGHFAVQIAKAKGALITATCSSKNIELAKQFGADEIIDYTKQDLLKMDKKFDAIFDAFGQMKNQDAIELLNPKGIFTTTLYMPTAIFSSLFIKLFHGKTFSAANMSESPENYQEIEDLFRDKKLKPLIENTFDLQHTKEAFNLMENGKPRGKIIIAV